MADLPQRSADPRDVAVFSVAAIETNEGLICARPHVDFVKPAIGDRFLVFSMVRQFITEDRTILVVNFGRELVHETAGGINAPPSLREFRTLDDLEIAARGALTKHDTP